MKHHGITTRVAAGLTALVLCSAGAAFAGSCSSSASQAHATNLVETAVEAGQFNTLVAAVEAAGLVPALQGDGPLTVFAPTDDAFAKLPAGTVEELLEPENKDKLTAILTYHVAPGRLLASDVVSRNSIETLNGQRPSISAAHGKAKIGDAKIVQTDISTSNGVIHVIDTVLLPNGNDIIGTAAESGSFETLAAALDAAGLVDALRAEGPFTVFAPTDAAFAKLPAGTVESLLKPENRDQLTAILTYHVVPGAVYSDDAGTGAQLETLQGSEVRVRAKADGLRVNDARIVTTDIATANGVIHVIDSVILPESVSRSMQSGTTKVARAGH